MSLVIEEIEKISEEISKLIKKKREKIKELADEVNKIICPRIEEKFGWKAKAKFYEDYDDPTWKYVIIMVNADVDCSDTNKLMKTLEKLRKFIDDEFRRYGKYVFFKIE